ncbi:hypothetical protein C0991_002419 [Blastosporella zonata]|nr:hypothetical protein C0991_002419 [Blastosporella zonata]
MDTVDKIEEYLESLEEYFFSSLSSATTDLPNIHEAVNRLWVDISRYGPGMPSFSEIHLPALGDFQVPPPPPPPLPVHASLIDKSANFAKNHPWLVGSVAVGVLGTSLLAGYGVYHKRPRTYHRVKQQSNERRQVIVVLGGDTPLALPLILDLDAKGYIIIASVSTPEAVATLEQHSHGYVRALVLDPHEPATISVFLRSLASTLSRKFPLTSSGDPFASPSSHPYIQSVICLLTLPSPDSSIHAPLEHISLRNTYLPFLSATHVTPLQVLQALMPLLRTGPARARDKGKKSIIVCLPAIDARVGLPFASMQAMSAAGTIRGVEVLRREINLAALTDPSESMKNIKIIVADVGMLDVGIYSNAVSQENIYKAMEGWSPSEKLAYGPAFASISHSARPLPSRWGMFSAMFKNREQYGVARTPSDTAVFVDKILSVVTDGRHNPYFFGLGRIIGQTKNWLRGERFSIGAGASTYRAASYLPSSVLDILISIPHFLISVRNRLLPVEPFVRPPPEIALPSVKPASADPVPSSDEDSHDNSNSEASSEADVESNASDSGVSASWVSTWVSAFERTRREPQVSDAGKGTSLWLVPSEDDAERLKTIMHTTRQHERQNFPSSYPNFHPHVTLASFPSTSTPSISDIRTAIAPLLQQRLAVKFQSVDIGTHFFRSVYIAITPTPAILALHGNVHAKLGIDPSTPSFPHVSLCYIDDKDALGGERERFLEELMDEGRIRYEDSERGGGVSLKCGGNEDGHGWMSVFEAKEVWVAECYGPVEDWTILGKISFT